MDNCYKKINKCKSIIFLKYIFISIHIRTIDNIINEFVISLSFIHYLFTYTEHFYSFF